MTLLATFQLLLSRYSRRDDVTVGTDLANRRLPETEASIGFFINTLVLRTDLSGDPTFRELLGRVRVVTLEAYAHQDVPFQELVQTLQPARNPSQNPLFQVMFLVQNAPAPPLAIKDLRVTRIALANSTSAFDLTVSLTENDRGGLEGVFRYSTDLFEDRSITAM